LPFLPLFDFVMNDDWGRRLNSSRAVRISNVTLRVLSGKSGKKRQGDVAVFGKGVATWG
jgi:hypothetical protein